MPRRGKDTRAARAVELFACPTCKARPGQLCTGQDGIPLQAMHGPPCHPLRRKLVTTLNKINTDTP